MTTTTRIKTGTLRLLRMLKALEDRDQVEIVCDALAEYAETHHADELGGLIESAKEDDGDNPGDSGIYELKFPPRPG